MPNLHDTPVPVRDLARQLSEPKPMRRGTLSVQYLRCNKPGCGCADQPGARHGPYAPGARGAAGAFAVVVPRRPEREGERRRRVGAEMRGADEELGRVAPEAGGRRDGQL